MQLCHLLTCSGLTRLKVSFIGLPLASSACWSAVPSSILDNLLQGVLFICCNQFLLYSYILPKTGIMFSSLAVSVYVLFPSRLMAIILPASSCEACL